MDGSRGTSRQHRQRAGAGSTARVRKAPCSPASGTSAAPPMVSRTSASMSRSSDRLRSPGEGPRQTRPTTPGDPMTLQRMDNVLIVVDDLEAAKAFFAELGMELEGEATN